MASTRIHDVLVSRHDPTDDSLGVRPSVKVGATVARGDVVAEIDSCKSYAELHAPVAGRVIAMTHAEVWPGAVALRIEENGAEGSEERTRPLPPARTPRVGELGASVDLRALEAHVRRLGSLEHGEATAVASRVVRGLSVVSWAVSTRPVTVAYVSVRAGIETRAVVSLTPEHDPSRIAALVETHALDVVIVRFHDTVEEVGPVRCRSRVAISIGAPRVEAERTEGSGAIALVPRASVKLRLFDEPAISRRALTSLVRALEAA